MILFFIHLRTVCKEELKVVHTRVEKHTKIGKISLSIQTLLSLLIIYLIDIKTFAL